MANAALRQRVGALLQASARALVNDHDHQGGCYHFELTCEEVRESRRADARRVADDVLALVAGYRAGEGYFSTGNAINAAVEQGFEPGVRRESFVAGALWARGQKPTLHSDRPEKCDRCRSSEQYAMVCKQCNPEATPIADDYLVNRVRAFLKARIDQKPQCPECLDTGFDRQVPAGSCEACKGGSKFRVTNVDILGALETVQALRPETFCQWCGGEECGNKELRTMTFGAACKGRGPFS